MENNPTDIYQVAPGRPMAVNINMRTIGGHDSKLSGERWCRAALVEPLHQPGHQPGRPTGDNLPPQVFYMISLTVQGIQGIVKTRLPLTQASLESADHLPDLRRHFG
jgi:hypothetical protein